MNFYERLAVNTFLSKYDERMSYREIITHIEEESDSILIWEPFMHIEKNTLIALMEDLLEEIIRDFLPKINLENDIKQALLRD
jgi:hypothetical protein